MVKTDRSDFRVILCISKAANELLTKSCELEVSILNFKLKLVIILLRGLCDIAPARLCDIASARLCDTNPYSLSISRAFAHFAVKPDLSIFSCYQVCFVVKNFVVFLAAD